MLGLGYFLPIVLILIFQLQYIMVTHNFYATFG